jgi:hypothetical protein
LRRIKRKPGERAASKDELAFTTCTSHRSLINRIRNKWDEVKLDEFSPLKFQE